MERASPSPQLPLLLPLNNSAEDGSVDLHGRTVSRSHTGRWRAALFIIGVESAERLAHSGISANLITYLTDVLHEATATAAKNVNTWAGVSTMLPLFGAFVADSYLGRYWTIVVASLVYLAGLIMLTLSASLPLPEPSAPDCRSSKASALQIGVFFFSLYLTSLGQGGHKPCLQAFGADQFDDEDPTERKYKISFFNWWTFGICTGTLTAVSVLTYIQDNMGWGLGFGIPAGAMAVALSVFLLGTRFYRHKLPGGTPLAPILRTFVTAARRWSALPASGGKSEADVIQENDFAKAGFGRPLASTDRFRLLEKARAAQVEEVKPVVRLIPIWMACMTFGVVLAQSPTFFTKQGSTMDRSIGPHFAVPPATLQSFVPLTILVLVPLYDRIFVPLVKDLTGNERGVTLLQRIGIGLLISTVSMIVAALTEMRRLQVARDSGLVDAPYARIPLSIFWLLPQYILFGMADVFAVIGMQEYFYDQMPGSMRSLGIAVYLSVYGVGNFLSSILISIVEQVSSRGKEQGWFGDNLNRAHLDYFYWLLAALSAVNLCIFISLASCFVYKQAETDVPTDEEAFHSPATAFLAE